MTQREKEVLVRIYRCVNQIASLGPSNPADIKLIVKAHGLTKKAGRDVAMAISSLGFGELGEACEYLADAERELS